MCLFSNILCFFYTNHNDGNCRWFWTQKTVAIFEMIWFSFIDYRRHLAEKTPVVRGCLWIMPFYLSLRLFYVEMRAFCCNALALKLSMLISAVIFLLVLFHPLLMGQGGSHFSGRHQIRLSQVIMSDPLNHSLSRLKNGFTAFLSKHKHCFVFWYTCIYIFSAKNSHQTSKRWLERVFIVIMESFVWWSVVILFSKRKYFNFSISFW